MIFVTYSLLDVSYGSRLYADEIGWGRGSSKAWLEVSRIRRRGGECYLCPWRQF